VTIEADEHPNRRDSTWNIDPNGNILFDKKSVLVAEKLRGLDGMG